MQILLLKFMYVNYIVPLLQVFLLCLAVSNQCLNEKGQVVQWWVKLIFPKDVPSGYAYFDSTFQAPSFVIYQQDADQSQTQLTNTLNQINEQQMDFVLWNDQPPNSQLSSSGKAHAKGILAYSQEQQTGFFITHSLPKFPMVDQQLNVNLSINTSQKYYGQNAFCISIDSQSYYSLITKILPIRPLIYSERFGTKSINQIIELNKMESPDYESTFTNLNPSINQDLLFIFKNGGKNASIFQDGLNSLLQSSLLSQTWGRPLQQSWCSSQYEVKNIKQISISCQIHWRQSQDHSKWTYAQDNDYSCFGDMNRMPSQWKRGGAFYCINSPLLRSALQSITSQVQGCQTQNQ